MLENPYLTANDETEQRSHKLGRRWIHWIKQEWHNLEWKYKILGIVAGMFLIYILRSSQPIIIQEINIAQSLIQTGHSQEMIRNQVLAKIHSIQTNATSGTGVQSAVIGAPREIPEFDVPEVGISYSLILHLAQRLLKREPTELVVFVTTDRIPGIDRPGEQQIQITLSVKQGSQERETSPDYTYITGVQQLVEEISRQILVNFDPFSAAVYAALEGDDPSALSMLEQIVASGQNVGVAHGLHAEILYDNGKPKLAFDELEKSVHEDPQFAARTYVEWGYLLLSNSNPDATNKFKQALVLAPGDAAYTYWIWGNVLLGQNKLPEAIDKFKQALQADPNDVSSCVDMAKAFVLAKQFPDAERIVKKALELKPSYSEAKTVSSFLYLNWGHVLAKDHHYDEAISAYRKVDRAESDLSLAEAYSDLSTDLASQDRCAEAVAGCRELVSLQPSNADAYESWGNCLQKLNQIPEAKEKFARASEARKPLRTK
jgi:tetratricopeptide (TPR) repeat protein